MVVYVDFQIISESPKSKSKFSEVFRVSTKCLLTPLHSAFNYLFSPYFSWDFSTINIYAE